MSNNDKKPSFGSVVAVFFIAWLVMAGFFVAFTTMTIGVPRSGGLVDLFGAAIAASVYYFAKK